MQPSLLDQRYLPDFSRSEQVNPAGADVSAQPTSDPSQGNRWTRPRVAKCPDWAKCVTDHPAPSPIPGSGYTDPQIAPASLAALVFHVSFPLAQPHAAASDPSRSARCRSPEQRNRRITTPKPGSSDTLRCEPSIWRHLPQINPASFPSARDGLRRGARPAPEMASRTHSQIQHRDRTLWIPHFRHVRRRRR